jgi:hypothetical protein
MEVNRVYAQVNRAALLAWSQGRVYAGGRGAGLLRQGTGQRTDRSRRP